ncbi:hypothetical protein BBJ28_00018062 [Nothophytophthora sp. Chile5]|nr:hypothetical protein BBJ28_00018062 [Nothophytophthora sp. Chile5]
MAETLQRIDSSRRHSIMLSALSSHLHLRRVILASQSPRRLELLTDCVRISYAGLAFEVIPSTFEENLPKERFPTPELYVLENAKQKALEVLRRVASTATEQQQPTPLLVIGCDTVVVLDGAILEKPKDEDDAFAMLTRLSGRAHDVFSGVALLTTSAEGGERPHLFFEKTSVVFGPLEPQDIRGSCSSL